MEKEKIEREIYYFCGIGMKPHPDFKSKFNRLWFSYFVKTPFFDLDSLGNLWNSFENILTSNRNQAMNQLNLLSKIFQLSADRYRVFYTYPQNISQIHNLLGENSHDLFLDASNPDAIEDLIRDAKEFQGKKFYLLWIDDSLYETTRNRLLELGFSGDKDYINIRSLFKTIPDLKIYNNKISKEL